MRFNEILKQFSQNVKPLQVINELYVPSLVDELLKYKSLAEEIGWKVIPVAIWRTNLNEKFKKTPLTEKKFEANWDREYLIKRVKRLLKGLSKNGMPPEMYLGLGLLTGKVNNITAIDFDAIPKWEKFGEIYQGNTLTQKTNNGYHVFFRYIKEARNKAGDGVDVRNDNGFVVIPPAFGYSFVINENTTIEDAPESVIEFLKQEGLIGKKTISPSVRALSRTEEPIEEDTEGIKNPSLLISAVREAYREGYVNGYDVDLLVSALAKRGISDEFLERLSREVFEHEFDDRRTAYMIERGLTLQRLRDVGSFIFKLPPELKRDFIKALGWKEGRAFVRRKKYSAQVIKRYVDFMLKKYCRFLTCAEDKGILKGERFTVEFEVEKLGELKDDYYSIYVYRNKIALPSEVEINGQKVKNILYPAHIFAVGENGNFYSVRVKATLNWGKVETTYIPKEVKGEGFLTILTDRLDEYFAVKEEGVRLVYSPFPELFISDYEGAIFATPIIEEAVKKKEFSKLVGVSDSVKEAVGAVKGNGRLKTPSAVAVEFLKEEIKKIFGWVKLTGTVPACLESFVERLGEDRNPYRVQTLLAFLKKFAGELFKKYSWLLEELLDVSLLVHEKEGNVSAKAERIVIPPFFPCVAYRREYCPHKSWRECPIQRFGDVFKVKVEAVNARNGTVLVNVDVVGQGVVKKEVQRGLEVDRIVRKIGALIEPNLLKYYKPLLELEISRAVNEAPEVLFPERIKRKIIHYAKEGICSLIAELRFASKEVNGEDVVLIPVRDLFNKIMSEFEKPLTEKVTFDEIRMVLDEYLGPFMKEGQFPLIKGKVRLVYEIPENVLIWFIEEVEGPVPPEHYRKRFETALKIAEERQNTLTQREREEEFKKSNPISDKLIDYMEQDFEYKHEISKSIKKSVTGEETPEDKFDALIPSKDIDVALYWIPDEGEDIPKEVIEAFAGVPVEDADELFEGLEVGQSKQEGKVKKTRIDEKTLLMEKDEKKVYITRDYGRFIELWEELDEKYEDRFVPVVRDDIDFIYTILERMGVPVPKDEIEYRIPDGVDEKEAKRREFQRKLIKLLKKEIGEERWEEMKHRLMLGDTSIAEEAITKAQGLVKMLREIEEREAKPETKELLSEEERSDVEEIMSDLDEIDEIEGF